MLILLLAALQQPPILVQHFPPIDRVGHDPYLARNLAALCSDESGASSTALLEREAADGRAVSAATRNADAWLQLGCSRALLQIAGVRSREGFEMPVGESWATASLTALRHALAIRPADARAADVAGLLAMDGPEPDHLQALAGALIAAVRAGVRGAPALRACAALALRIHDGAGAQFCAATGLVSGHDSTEHLLTLARLRFRNADTAAGWGLFLQGVSTMRDSLAWNDVNWHLQWMLWPAEREAWDTVAPAARGAWVSAMLTSRDVRDAQPAGARLAEHFGRLEYADSAFRLRVPRALDTELRTGMTAHDSGSASVDFRLDPDRMYARWQTDFDDRGVIWMRFGKPLHRASHFDRGRDARQALPNGQIRFLPPGEREAWSYLLDGQPLVLTFDVEEFAGSAAPSRLIPGYIGKVDCLGVDQWRCGLAMGTLRNGNGRTVYAQDREYIAAATTTDDNSVRSEHPIATTARLHRLWDPATGLPIALITYAFHATDLSVHTSDHGPAADVTLTLRRWNGLVGGVRDTTFIQEFPVQPGTRKRVNLTGFTIVPSSADVKGWSLVATQPGDRRGRDFDVTAPPAGDSALQLSDLVLGQSDQPIVWATSSGKVLLDPINAVGRALPVDVYFQVKSTADNPDLRLNIAMYDNTNGVRGTSAVVQVSSAQRVHAGLNEITRVMDVSRPGKGQYLLEVRLLDAAGAERARRDVRLAVN